MKEKGRGSYGRALCFWGLAGSAGFPPADVWAGKVWEGQRWRHLEDHLRAGRDAAGWSVPAGARGVCLGAMDALCFGAHRPAAMSASADRWRQSKRL